MPRKKETLTLSVSPGTRERLDRIADRLGFHWGKSPSPSALVTAIAEGAIKVGSGDAIKAAQVDALRQAIADLTDAGHIEEAKSVITLLLQQGELEPPLRQQLLRQSSQPLTGFRREIEQLCQRRQPFQLLYRRPNGNSEELTANYAEMTFYEKRFYLQIWTEALPERGGIAELQHNRCLRLDRIEAILETEGSWRGRLDTIDVEMRLLNGLARAYEAKSEDIADDQGAPVRTITRRVINLFWLIREVRRYGSDCVVTAPEAVREQIADDLATSLSHYRQL